MIVHLRGSGRSRGVLGRFRGMAFLDFGRFRALPAYELGGRFSILGQIQENPRQNSGGLLAYLG